MFPFIATASTPVTSNKSSSSSRTDCMQSSSPGSLSFYCFCNPRVQNDAKTDQPLKQNILAMKQTNGQNTSADETTTPSQQEVQPRTNIAPVAGFGTLISGRNDPDPLSVDFLAAAIIRIFWKDKQNDQKHTRTPLSQPLRTFPPIPKKCYRRQTHRRNEYR